MSYLGAPHPGALTVGSPQRVEDEGVAQPKDKAGDDGYGHQSGQIQIANGDGAENQGAHDPADPCCTTGVFQQAADPDLHAADEAAAWCGNHACNAMGAKLAIEIP